MPLKLRLSLTKEVLSAVTPNYFSWFKKGKEVVYLSRHLVLEDDIGVPFGAEGSQEHQDRQCVSTLLSESP